MIFPGNRDALRGMYRDAWKKRQAGLPLSPLETQIADVVAEHPEYQAAVAAENLGQDFTPADGQANPFLHMGLHLGLREQVATDRPAGIARLHRQILVRARDAHDAEHRMIECLAETLWEAQSANAAPDDRRYLERLRQLAGGGL